MAKKPRLSKREELRLARRRRQRLTNLILAGVGLLVVGGIVWFVLANRRPGEVSGERLMLDEGSAHIELGQTATYQNNPPSSGPHYGAATAPAGFSEEEIQPEYWVHSLEHGYIVFLYHCPEDCPDLKDRLRDLAGRLPNSKYGTIKVVVTSYASPLPGEVTALAWNRQLDLESYDETLLTQFYERWVDRGPEDVP